MKKVHCIIALLALAVISCKKTKNQPIGEDFGCITRIWNSPASSVLPAKDYTDAVSLFNANSIDYSRFLLYNVRRDTFSGIASVNVLCEQFLNSLPLFTNLVEYDFKSGVTDYFSANIISSTTLDTVANLKITQVRKLFVDQITGPNSSMVSKPYKDSCVVAEFGYYNTNSGSGNQQVNLVKAWYVHPQSSTIPYAYIKDDGFLLSFFNGVLTL